MARRRCVRPARRSVPAESRSRGAAERRHHPAQRLRAPGRRSWSQFARAGWHSWRGILHGSMLHYQRLTSRRASCAHPPKRASRARKTAATETMKVPKGLQPLIDDGVIDEVIRSLKSGKEATVYIVRSGPHLRCAKVYRDMAQRSFQRRAQYQEGRKVRGSRETRAM